MGVKNGSSKRFRRLAKLREWRKVEKIQAFDGKIEALFPFACHVVNFLLVEQNLENELSYNFSNW